MSMVYITKSKNRTGAQNDMDVVVSYNKVHRSAEPCVLRFSFSETIKEKAFKHDSYIMFAYDRDKPTRIYVTGADEVNGYKLSRLSGDSKRYYCAPSKLADVVKAPKVFIGNYFLDYDPDVRMWFIDCDKKFSDWWAKVITADRKEYKNANQSIN